MKNIVTFKTAADLKVAGFPQPEPAPGQIWYNPDFGLFVVGPRLVGDEGLVRIFYLHTGKAYAKEKASFSECIFAPDVADILGELFPERKCVSFGAMDLLVMALDPEASALAYLEFKRQWKR